MKDYKKFKFTVVTMGPSSMAVSSGMHVASIASSNSGVSWMIQRVDSSALENLEVYLKVGRTAMCGAAGSTESALLTVIPMMFRDDDRLNEWAVVDCIIEELMWGSAQYKWTVTYDSETELCAVEQDEEAIRLVDEHKSQAVAKSGEGELFKLAGVAAKGSGAN